MTRLRMVVLGGIYLLCADLPMCLAADPPVPIEGRILVSADEMSVGAYSYFIEGMSDNVSLPGPVFPYAEMSPDMERVAY